MEDLIGKMQDIISDPESMKQIQEIDDMISNGDSNDNSEAETNQDENKQDENAFDDFDMGKILSIISLLGNMENDKDTNLLLALKPHLKPEKQEKVDKIVKLMKIFTILSEAFQSTPSVWRET